MGKATIYTVVISGADADRGCFHDPHTIGSYLSLPCARAELARLVDEKKRTLDDRYDSIEDGDDYWEASQNGYALLCFVRIEILTSALRGSTTDEVAPKCPCDHKKEAPV